MPIRPRGTIRRAKRETYRSMISQPTHAHVRAVATMVALGMACLVLVAQEPPVGLEGPAVVQPGTAGLRPERIVGLWAYNSQESLNVVTGRPERGAPGSAPPRPVIPRPRPSSTNERGDSESPFAPSPQALREYRDLARDLLEIAETLAFSIDGENVTITDDLARARTFPTDDSRHRYRLGASEFFARVRWDGARLLREIEGTFGRFQMNETYFMSPDANRLFLIIRVGEPMRGRQPPGVDRVYDRIAAEDE